MSQTEFSEEDALKELTQKMHFSGVNSWGCYPGSLHVYGNLKDGIFKGYDSACMSNIAGAKKARLFWIYNVRRPSINRNPEEVVGNPVFWAWTCWLSDLKESPWRLVLPKEKSWIIQGVDVHSTKFRDTYGWLFNNVDQIPGWVFISFCKAIRNPTERYFTMSSWYELVKRGVHPALAYIISPCVSLSGEQTSLLQTASFGHGCVSANMLTSEDVKRFALGQPKTSSPTIQEGCSYTGNDSIWEDSIRGGDKWQSLVYTKVKDRGKAPQSSSRGMFNKVPITPQSTQISTFKIADLIAVLKEEQVRLGIPESHLLKRIEEEKNA